MTVLLSITSKDGTRKPLSERKTKQLAMMTAMSLKNLSPELQLELKDLQQHISDSEAYMVGLDTVKQQILEAKNHDERSKLMTYFVEVERKRLERKKTSRG
jgi:hypothetical protein